VSVLKKEKFYSTALFFAYALLLSSLCVHNFCLLAKGEPSKTKTTVKTKKPPAQKVEKQKKVPVEKVSVLQVVNVTVNGMVCSFCVQGLEKAFTKEKSVKSVVVSLSDKLVVLSLKENMDISDEKIKSIVENTGYNVKKIKRSSVSVN
tara:strand:+ start:528 stop:971 length:444 start_codon:yes stop_codon:yes gene_type:complete